jgi:hypothetical protein
MTAVALNHEIAGPAHAPKLLRSILTHSQEAE